MTPLEYARTQVGKAEDPKGSNWGADVKRYLSNVGIKFPAAWCMAFVQTCFLESGRKLPLKTGGVLALYGASLKYKVASPAPGDVMIMRFKGGKGHTGIVESVNGDKVTVIEGNSNDEHSREGYEVCRNTRPISSIHAFLRFP